MLFSFVNMKLRDEFGGDLDELCGSLDVDKQWLINRLASAGFESSAQQKRFW